MGSFYRFFTGKPSPLDRLTDRLNESAARHRKAANLAESEAYKRRLEQYVSEKTKAYEEKYNEKPDIWQHARWVDEFAALDRGKKL